MVAAAPEVKALPKPSRTRLYILLAVFAVMAGALGTLSVTKSDLVESTIAWVMNSPMHAASNESRVLVNGKWVTTSNPEAMLNKAPVAKTPALMIANPAVVVTSIQVLPPVDSIIATEAPAAETAQEGAFDIGAATK
jgi:hypothetical protein